MKCHKCGSQITSEGECLNCAAYKEVIFGCPVCDSPTQLKWITGRSFVTGGFSSGSAYAARVCMLCDFSWKDEEATQRAEKFFEDLKEKEKENA